LWRQATDDYIAARRRHSEAERLMKEADDFAWDDLAKRPGMTEERAYELAGCRLADQRSLRAYAAEREAFSRLNATLVGADWLTLKQVRSMVLCADLRPEDAANHKSVR
jgi:hypothetical protein